MTSAAADTLTAYELAYGKPRPDLRHAAIQASLLLLLGSHLPERFRAVGPVLLPTTPTGLVPNLAIYEAGLFSCLPLAPPAGTRPMCVIELEAASQPTDAVLKRVQVYFQFGVRSCWVIQPAVQGVFVFDRPGSYTFFHGDDTLRDATLDLELPLGPVFA